ncbi:MAG TPA: hypothetical protein VHC67_06030 [Gaiellaceae bacterium]|nr:hypothetical protein [Gaiellaceae bacterium]
MTIVRPTWSTWSFLVYAGGLTTVLALGGWLAYLASRSGQGGDFGWAVLLFVLLAGIAEAFRRTGHRVTAGVFAYGAVAAGVVAAALLFAWFGWQVVARGPIGGFHPARLVLEALWVVLAAAALRRFRFPLLVAQLAGAIWLFVVDLVSNGGAWTAVVSVVVGLSFALAAVLVDGGERRPYGFWLHVAAGLAIGGAVLHWFGDDSIFQLVLVGLASVGYVLVARALQRSSWAVLGTAGLFVVADRLAGRWTSVHVFFGEGVEGPRLWVPPLVFMVLGALLVALGLAVSRRPAAG